MSIYLSSIFMSIGRLLGRSVVTSGVKKNLFPVVASAAHFTDGVIRDGENPKSITNAEWKKRLSPQQYHICREKGTEAPFEGEYVHHSEAGTYVCVCCSTPLFSSETKFDSGSGWPSFYEPLSSEDVLLKSDSSFGMRRVEVLCKNCECHLGHVFPDGPEPTGQRYCINSVSLSFKPKQE